MHSFRNFRGSSAKLRKAPARESSPATQANDTHITCPPSHPLSSDCCYSLWAAKYVLNAGMNFKNLLNISFYSTLRAEPLYLVLSRERQERSVKSGHDRRVVGQCLHFRCRNRAISSDSLNAKLNLQLARGR